MDIRIERMKKELDEAKKKLHRWEKEAENRIKDKPLQSVLIAAGVGALAGVIVASMMRRK
jgi:ElaB/YqjD/DUF883 family membrane-anchored ribosome-binding protein